MDVPFIGQIERFAFPFAPDGWLPCDGRLLSIGEYTTLFQLIGTTYGGDGQVTFALPDLQGRVPIGMGQGNNLSSYSLGQQVGAEGVTLDSTQIPSHTHFLLCSSAAAATTNVPSDTMALADENAQVVGLTNVFTYSSLPTPTTTALSPKAVTSNGGQPHENRQPFTVINYCIAVAGQYPAGG